MGNNTPLTDGNHFTIKGYNEEFGMYRLSFPKREIEERFVRCVCCLFMEQRKHRTFLANRFIYMMEFILNGTEEEALQ